MVVTKKMKGADVSGGVALGALGRARWQVTSATAAWKLWQVVGKEWER